MPSFYESLHMLILAGERKKENCQKKILYTAWAYLEILLVFCFFFDFASFRFFSIRSFQKFFCFDIIVLALFERSRASVTSYTFFSQFMVGTWGHLFDFFFADFWNMYALESGKHSASVSHRKMKTKRREFRSLLFRRIPFWGWVVMRVCISIWYMLDFRLWPKIHLSTLVIYWSHSRLSFVFIFHFFFVWLSLFCIFPLLLIMAIHSFSFSGNLFGRQIIYTHA